MECKASPPATDNEWYFFDPYGIYETPDCYPQAVDEAIYTACSRYPIAWKGENPDYPLPPVIASTHNSELTNKLTLFPNPHLPLLKLQA